MSLPEIIAVLVSLAALFSYLNARYIGLPTAIGVMAIALAFSFSLVALEHLGLASTANWAEQLIGSIRFDETVLRGMLSFLLFAGALHVDVDDLAEQKWVISMLASASVVASTVLVGSATWLLLGWIGVGLPYVYCLLFGALISPTDPIAVLGILKSMGAPRRLSTKIAGEALFNDGVAVVVFLAILGLATGAEAVTADGIALLFLREVAGGILLGVVLGYVACRALRRIDNYQVEILITLALVMGGYGLAARLGLSGPLLVVVAGLLIGHHGRRRAMSARTRERMDDFWELVDEILSAVLFLLIGLEVLVIVYNGKLLLAGILAIPPVLAARTVSVSVPLVLLGRRDPFNPKAVRVMTWGGLRGGISVALALSLPPGPERDVLVGITYVVVVFSILVQGTMVRRLAGKAWAGSGPGAPVRRHLRPAKSTGEG